MMNSGATLPSEDEREEASLSKNGLPGTPGMEPHGEGKALPDEKSRGCKPPS